jgi:adenylate kinase
MIVTLEQLIKWSNTEIDWIGHYGYKEHREALTQESDLYRDVASIGYAKVNMPLYRRCSMFSISSDVPIVPGMNMEDLKIVNTYSRENVFTPLEIYLKLFPAEKTNVYEKIMKLSKCILVIGGPGCGKGTLADKIKGEFNTAHVSTGDIVRKEMKDDTPLGRKMKDYLGKGLLVPDDMSTDMLKNFLNTFQMRTFILDGFPRTLSQAEELSSILREYKASVSCAIFLDVQEAELIRRIEARDRPDDKGVVTKRLSVYKEQTAPAVEYLKKTLGDKFFTINGNRTPAEVYQQVRPLLSF